MDGLRHILVLCFEQDVLLIPVSVGTVSSLMICVFFLLCLKICIWFTPCHASLQWCHNGRDSVSNHEPHDCLLNCLFKRRSKKTGEIPAEMANNAKICFHLMTSLCFGVHWYRSCLPISLMTKSMVPSDAIWQQRSGWTLAEIITCCPTALSHHYLHQCWLIRRNKNNKTKHSKVFYIFHTKICIIYARVISLQDDEMMISIFKHTWLC